jgi:Uma2 family endonuclease
MAVLSDHLHRLTVEDYLRLVGDDGTGRWERTELVEGLVYDRSPESALHAHTVMTLLSALAAARPDRRVLNAGSVEVGPRSLWNPDVYVLRPGTSYPPVDRQYPLADDVELAVEVSVTSLSGDTTVKCRAYAAAGLPEYWIVVPQPGGYVERFGDPETDRYRTIDRFELPAGYADLDVAVLLA